MRWTSTLLLGVLVALISAGRGQKSTCDHCVKEWNDCLSLKCPNEERSSLIRPVPGMCGWHCKEMKRSCFDKCFIETKVFETKFERNFLVKPAKVPYIETKEDGELLVYISPLVLKKGFLLLIHAGNSTADVLHKVDHASLVSDHAPSHVDRRNRLWYTVPTPLEAHKSGVNRLTVVLHYRGGPAEGEESVITLIKATPTESRVVHVDHRLDAVVDLDGLPMIISGMYIHGVDQFFEPVIPDLEAPHGFNTILAYISSEQANVSAIVAFMDRCYKLGVNFIVEVGQFCSKHTSAEIDWDGMEKLVLAVRNHPALLGYYLADEPGGAGIPENILREGYEFLKGLDPYHPVFMVFCCVDPAVFQLDFDIGMVDPYPVPNGPPASILNNLNAVAAVGKPFALVPQAFGGGEWWWRTPTPREIRMMTHLALMSGASGFIFFVYGPRYIPYSTSLWSECRTLALEALDLAGSLLGGQTPLQVTILQAGVLATGYQNRLKGYDVIVINTNATPTMYVADLHVTTSGSAEVRYQSRQVNMKEGIVEDYIGAYGVSILRFPKPPSNSSPKNVIFNPSYELVTAAATPDASYLGVEQDWGASYLADSRLSTDGLYSLRLVAPEPGAGYAPSGYPFSVMPGGYQFSVYVYAHHPGVQVDFVLGGPLHAQGSTTHTVKTADTWEKLSVAVNCTQSGRGQYISFQLTSSGTVWIDLMQLIPDQ